MNIVANDEVFIMRNLHKLQAGRGGNAPGQPEIPEQMAMKNGLIAALGDSRHERLALWQVMARVINQGSRLSAHVEKHSPP